MKSRIGIKRFFFIFTIYRLVKKISVANIQVLDCKYIPTFWKLLVLVIDWGGMETVQMLFLFFLMSGSSSYY